MSELPSSSTPPFHRISPEAAADLLAATNGRDNVPGTTVANAVYRSNDYRGTVECLQDLATRPLEGSGVTGIDMLQRLANGTRPAGTSHFVSGNLHGRLQQFITACRDGAADKTLSRDMLSILRGADALTADLARSLGLTEKSRPNRRMWIDTPHMAGRYEAEHSQWSPLCRAVERLATVIGVEDMRVGTASKYTSLLR